MATDHAVTPVRYEIHKIGRDSSIITMTAAIAKSCNFLSSHRVMYTVFFPLSTHPRENGPLGVPPHFRGEEARVPKCVLVCVGWPSS